ncbi:MAG: SGNH/GDSL hydrolase family protein [Proteobacteria bacterium]|nr:SGNH/GDSL hydrolase family protein [Pseudomonadota bacterium]
MSRLLALLAAAVAIAAPVAAEEDGQGRCSAPSALVTLAAPLRTTTRTVSAGEPLRIVALGSSSTAGVGASAPERAYPRLLERELRQRLGGLSVQVVNKGVGGQLAADMLMRIERDVIALRPALVIWQTGTNDLLRGVPVELFERQLGEGIARLKAAGIDIVLMTLQYFPRIARLAGYERYVESMQRLAERQQVPVLRRFRIMRHWATSDAAGFDRTLAADRFHMSDAGYECLALLLAEGIIGGLER